MWAEKYSHAVKGCLKLIEPRKFRNELFEAAKILVPQKLIKFSPVCPKYDTLVFDDGTERKLGKTELASLIQMDLMKEEIISMVRVKTPGTGNITYQLPPEKRNKMHDDRAYVFVMACWQIKKLREESEFGDGVGIDYSRFFDKSPERNQNANDPWSKMVSGVKTNNTSKSPFQGKSPFIK